MDDPFQLFSIILMPIFPISISVTMFCYGHCPWLCPGNRWRQWLGLYKVSQGKQSARKRRGSGLQLWFWEPEAEPYFRGLTIPLHLFLNPTPINHSHLIKYSWRDLKQTQPTKEIMNIHISMKKYVWQICMFAHNWFVAEDK